MPHQHDSPIHASPAAMKPLGLALVGAGRMGAVHARILQQVGRCRVVRVVDDGIERARLLAASLGAEAGTDLGDALDDERVDAAVIVTPAPTHADLVAAFAAAGKALFVEKPLATTLADAQRAVRAVERAGVPAQVGFQRRYDAAYARAKERIDAGELGRLEGFRGVGRDPFPPPLEYLRSSGDLLVDMGIHDLDSARFLVGEVAEVHAIGAALAVPELGRHGLYDTVVATLRFENGALGTIEVGLRTAYGYDIRAEVLGEKGRLHIEMDRRPDLLAYDARGGSFERPRGFEERFEPAYRAELSAFVGNVLAGRDVTPTPRDAMASLRLALAAQHALETGRTVAVGGFGTEEVGP